MNTERNILEEYVASAMLMQVATVSDAGYPALCHVWYNARFRPDRLYFTSRHDRGHSINIRANGKAAGGIVAIPLSGLGQTVRGVTFKGQAQELAADARIELESFLERWPRARDTITLEKIARQETASRLYEIRIAEWVLFDEANFSDSPRRVIPGNQGEDIQQDRRI